MNKNRINNTMNHMKILFPLILLSMVFSVNSIEIATDTTILASDSSFDNQDLTVNGVVLTIDGSHTFLDVELINGATLIHSQGVSGLEISVNNLTIDSTSKIDVSGKSDVYDSNLLSTNSGASYGGSGLLYDSSGFTNPVYGDLRQPSDLGTAGSSFLGGGAIKLNVTGTLDLSGEILANGEFSNSYYRGSSGGSIWLNVATLTGVGVIQANGTDSYITPGGGGRIAVYYDVLNGFDLEGQISAYGGQYQSNPSYPQAGAGSIYLKDNAQSLGEIRIVNQIVNEGIQTGETPIGQPSSGDIIEAIILINAKIDIQSDVTTLNQITSNHSEITQSHDLVIDNLIMNNGSSWSQIGQLTVNNTYQFYDSSINHQAQFTIPEAVPYVISNGMHVILNTTHDSWTSIEVQSNSTLELNVVNPTLGILNINGGMVDFNVSHSFTSINITNTGVLTHRQALTGFTLDVVNLTIDSTSKIDVSGKSDVYDSNLLSTNSGASYGGSGLLYDSSGFTNPVYGDLRQPSDLGTAGSSFLGGGAIKLNVTGTLDLSGEILANGEFSNSYYRGSSGGSIWLNVATLTGVGVIQANGTDSYITPGGGGRIAVYYDVLNGFDLEGQITAYGGQYQSNPSRPQAGAGTIY